MESGDDVMKKYPPDSRVKGTVRNLTNYGAFIELEEGVDGLLHVSDMSWTRKVSHANEMLKKGEELECLVLSVDEDRKRIALGLKQSFNFFLGYFACCCFQCFHDCLSFAWALNRACLLNSIDYLKLFLPVCRA